MCFYIGIEDLAANALIEILTKNSEKRFVSYEELENYGAEVVKFLCEKGEKAILILSRDCTEAMFRNYSDFFEEQQSNGKFGILLKEGISIESLEKYFRGYISLDVLRAFVNEQSISKLGACA